MFEKKKKKEKRTERWPFHRDAKKKSIVIETECLLNGYVLIRKFRDFRTQTLENVVQYMIRVRYA